MTAKDQIRSDLKNGKNAFFLKPEKNVKCVFSETAADGRVYAAPLAPSLPCR